MRRRLSALSEVASRAEGMRRDALLAVVECLEAADPGMMVEKAVRSNGRTLNVRNLRLKLSVYKRLFVIGGGKASALMAEKIEEILGGMITEGRVIVPESQCSLPELSRIRFRHSTHPLPTTKGVRAVNWMLEQVREPKVSDLVICLVSGGGSAMMPMPAHGLTIEEKQEVTRLLLRSGAEIGEQNCVRKHISGIKGGRLVELLRPARVLSLIVSDVVGNDLASVASGPSAPDPTTYAQAKQVLTKHALWRSVPESVRSLIQSGMDGSVPETPKPGSKLFSRVNNVLIGSNTEPCDSARRALEGMGYDASVFSTTIEGEARVVGSRLAGLATGAARRGRAVALVAGGETTVHVTGRGAGGRNQELVLSAAIRIAGKRGITIASFGTDGVDGPTSAAGALADSDTVAKGKAIGMEAKDYLRENDSNTYFRRLDSLIVTGPTGTNVNDVMIALVRERD